MAALDPETADQSVGTARSQQARGYVHLRLRADFLHAAKGSRFHTTAFSLHAAANGPRVAEIAEMPARFGLTVTKKTAGAVQRNRIRRRLREAVRTGAVAAKPGYDYVLVARQDALTVPFVRLVEDVARALEGIHARRGGRGRGRVAASTMKVRPVDLVSIDRSGPHGQEPVHGQSGRHASGQEQVGQDQFGKDQ